MTGRSATPNSRHSSELDRPPALRFEFPTGFYEGVAEHLLPLLAEQLGGSGLDPWLDVEGAARHLGYGDGDEAKLKRGCARVYDLKARGLIDHRKDGSRLLFRRAWLDAYAEGAR